MEQKKIINNSLMVLAGLALIVAIVYLVFLSRNTWRSYDYIGKTPDVVNQITVNGTAKIIATPDVAMVTLGIVNDGITVAIAQKGVTDKMNNIINSLKREFKIESKDIKTENYSVQPKYNWNDGKQRIIGFTVNQSVQVKVRNFDDIGNILVKATELGANSVYGPNFMIDDSEKVKAEVREKAIAQAKEKANLLADQVGIKLGRIVNFYEGGNEVPNVAYDMSGYAMLEARDKTKSVAPAIEAGSQDIQLTVSISYEIK